MVAKPPSRSDSTCAQAMYENLSAMPVSARVKKESSMTRCMHPLVRG